MCYELHVTQWRDGVKIWTGHLEDDGYVRETDCEDDNND
jgi:hypothetical protein